MVLILNLAAVVERFARLARNSAKRELRPAADRRRARESAWAQPEVGHEPDMNSSKARIRVLVVDDSALMRKLIPQMLAHGRLDRSRGHRHGWNFGLKKIEELKPHVVTLDLEMPGMSGIDMLKEIMRRHRVPVIVVSSHSTEGASVTLKALALGAFDFVAKPNDVSARMAGNRARTDRAKSRPRQRAAKPRVLSGGAAEDPRKKATNAGNPSQGRRDRHLHRRTAGSAVSAAATAGDFPAAIVVVQHMPENFTEMFARRLDELLRYR